MASLDSTSKPENKSLRVLVTGFGPFRNIETNPSWLAAKPLSNQTLKFTQSASPGHPHAPKPRPVEVEVHISTLEVPVTYSAVLGTVPPIHQSKQYDFILHVGVGLSGGVAIERLAHKTGYNQPDAEGRLCDLIRSKPKGDDADELVKRGSHLKSKGLEHTSPSNDPGRYLCDFIYFCSLACAQKEASKVKVLFMHVPPVGSPYQIEDMTGAIKGVIEYVALHT
ncbi:pyroglutamyl-peptidase [Rhizoctonia solani]|uniref:Pyroglutamyl-peptidase n=1 Tax=Rhizoctonia solani TaxID=456999 RepID=A0A8H7M184_9AGAM|nr:pyroglutamyl-peptidase [Rhizoctonia solani]